jgi:hypothetical protein
MSIGILIILHETCKKAKNNSAMVNAAQNHGNNNGIEITQLLSYERRDPYRFCFSGRMKKLTHLSSISPARPILW